MSEIDYDLLIMNTSKGNAEAFKELYLNLKDAVYALSLSISGSYSIAEDIMQDTFLRVRTNAQNYVPKGFGKAWVLKIARNNALNFLRSNKRLSYTDDSFANLTNEEQAFDQIADSLLLREVTGTLNKEQREVILLKAIDSFTFEEIADIVDSPVGTVKWRYHQAMKKMKKYLQSMERM